jgi:hypothetical protein
MKNLNITLLLALLPFVLHSQDTLDLGFRRAFDIPVIENGKTLKYPWLGGINSCQFAEVDLNRDGIMDMIVFDRVGDVLMPFINGGTPDSSDYTYAPEYISDFPYLRHWVIMRDYDMDGKNDLFTYTHFGGGIAVYRNVSDTSLKFEQMTGMLNSFYYVNYINIFLTDVDYPGIYDVDGDGDLDILTFFGLGSYVEFHKNMSMEKYGVPDSLDFMMVDKCWGRIFESETSNELDLNVPCPFKGDCDSLDAIPYNPDPEAVTHMGSTFLLLDLNADSLVDLVLGDVDYPNVVALINGGTPDSAVMVSQDTAFPSNTRPIRLFSFPVLSYLDINNDGINELLVSPFDPSPILPSNYNSVWLYENQGENNAPLFSFVKETWMQDEMIDLGGGSYPVLIDEDGDGLLDLIVGNFGYRDTSWYSSGFLYSSFRASLALYRNTGTATQAAFTLIDRDYANVSAQNHTGAIPAFADLDGDGDLDMLIGREDGTFDFYRNHAGPGQPMQLQFESHQYQNLDVGQAAAPQFIDLSGNQLPDLVSGNKEGTLVYFENIGTASQPVFQHITDTLGGVDVRDPNLTWSAYSVPAFFRDTLDSIRLIVGNDKGQIAYYRNIQLQQDFTLVDNLLQFMDEGIRSAPCLADLDSDGIPEMIIGNYRGGLSLYYGVPSLPTGLPPGLTQHIPDFRLFPNPAQDRIYLEINHPHPGNGWEVQIYDLSGRIIHSELRSPSSHHNLELSRLSPGAYLLSIQARGQQIRSKAKLFIKQ